MVYTNVNVNPANNGWIIFVTPKFIEGVGDRVYVARNPEELGKIVALLAQNVCPNTGSDLNWPEGGNGP